MQTNRPAQQRPQAVQPPPEFQAGNILTMDSAQLVGVLKDSAATDFQKMKACQRLAVVGTKDAVPVLAGMLGNEKLAHYARFGMVPIPDPSVDEALRAATARLKGKLLVGAINSIGQRRDAKAIPLLSRFLSGADKEAALAAAASLGCIGGPAAVKVLQDALVKTKGPVRTAAAEAALVAAEGLLAQGDRKGALALYAALSRTDMPKPVRLAAMHSTIVTETAINRPRPPAPAKK